jgi:arylsulfatase A-like enzyme
MSDRDFDVLRRLYDAEIAYLDRALRKLVAALERSWRPTLLVITSDHGENIGEHELMDHQFSLHDTLIKVPLLVRYPDRADAGVRRDELVGLGDVHGTLLAAAEAGEGTVLPGPPGGARRPHITADYLRPQPPVSRLRTNFPDGEFTRCDRSLRALMRDDGRKLIWASNGAHEEYDLRADPSEQRSLYDAASSAGLVSALEAAFDKGGATPAGEVAATGEDEDVRAALESLGYL